MLACHTYMKEEKSSILLPLTETKETTHQLSAKGSAADQTALFV